MRRPTQRESSLHPGIKAYAKGLAKYGAPDDVVSHYMSLAAAQQKKRKQPPTKSSGENVADNDGEAGPVVAAPDQNDKEYLTPLTIGKQTFIMDFDTGSSDL